MFSLLLFAAAPDIEAARQQLIVRCGIPGDRLVIEPSGDPPENVIIVKGDGPLYDAQLTCLGTVMSESGGVNFSIEDPAIGEQYGSMVARERLASARADLANRGLLERLPVYDAERMTLKAFGHQLERLCGVAPGSMLKVDGENLVVRNSAFHTDSFRRFDRVTCLLSATTLAGFEPFGGPTPTPTVLYATAPAS